MPFSAGTKLGPYDILAPIGAGGMGEVYKARDTRLDRIVAIKILPAGKTGDSQRARFFQEARAASALNHPHIVAIYDIGREGDHDYIVMEYVAGKTIGQSIPRKGMRLDEALRVAAQIADALAAAHAAGIVHRDLKPGNVMIAANGSVKVLDFGLAKLAGPPGDNDTDTRTMVAEEPRTADGMIVGTAGYMSPEQAQGQPVDSRSDIFSFGALFYEMLTGIRAFRGDSTLATLTAVLHGDPRPVRHLAEGTPSDVERVVNRCLRKDPAKRFQNTGDLKVALEELQQESDSGALAPSADPASPARGRKPVWIAVAFLVLSAAGAGWWLHKPAAEGPQDVVAVSPLTSFPGLQSHPSFSPDGNQVAFVWRKEGDREQHVYVKLVGPGNPIRITMTAPYNACPEWSPDGASIAFISASTPQKYALATAPALGGPERVVAEYQNIGCPSWSPDGQWLVFSRGSGTAGSIGTEGPNGIWAVSVATGAAHKVTSPSGTDAFGDAVPTLSPDGRTLAFARLRSANGRIYLLSLSTDMQPQGDPQPITPEDQRLRRIAWMPDGAELVYSAGSSLPTSGLWRVRASGGQPRRVTGIDVGIDPAVSRPRGPGLWSRLAFARATDDSNVWRLPMQSGKPGAPEEVVASSRRDFEPRYSPDGSRIAFTSDRSGYSEVWASNADGSAPVQLSNMRAITTGCGRWSPDGRQIALCSNASGTSQLYLVDPNGGAPRRLTYSQSHDTAPSWSRDGKWIYFASTRSGRFEVWKIAPEPHATPIQLSTHGGYAALESWDGKTLYFAKTSQSGQIVGIPPSGGEETPLPVTVDTWGDWDVTPEGIVFIPSGARRVCLYSFVTKQTRTLAELHRAPDFGLTVSPKDGSILYTTVDHASSELELVERFR